MQRILTLALVLLFAVSLNAQSTIYNSIPTPVPPTLTSQSFQAQRISEFGNLIQFPGNSNSLASVTVAMVTWAYFSKYNMPGIPNTGGWIDPAITLNLYTVDASGQPVTPPFAHVTNTLVNIPWRPEADTTNCPGTTEWYGPDQACHNGMAFLLNFDFKHSVLSNCA